MKRDWKEGLYMGLCIWLLSLILGIPLGLLLMGYLPRYLLQLVLAIILLVRACKHPSMERWIGLFTLEDLVLVGSAVHIIRGNTIMSTGTFEIGFQGLAMFLAGCIGLGTFVILLAVSVCLFARHKDEARTAK